MQLIDVILNIQKCNKKNSVTQLISFFSNSEKEVEKSVICRAIKLDYRLSMSIEHSNMPVSMFQELCKQIFNLLGANFKSTQHSSVFESGIIFVKTLQHSHSINLNIPLYFFHFIISAINPLQSENNNLYQKLLFKSHKFVSNYKNC